MKQSGIAPQQGDNTAATASAADNPPLDRLPGSLVPGQQRNHGAWWRPATLAHLPPLPLYLAAAHWSLLTGTVLSGPVVSQVFRLETRRALEVLRHLLRSDTPVTVERLPGNPLRLRIVAIPAAPTVSRDASASGHRAAADGSDSGLAHARLLRWFLTRPVTPGRQ